MARSRAECYNVHKINNRWEEETVMCLKNEIATAICAMLSVGVANFRGGAAELPAEYLQLPYISSSGSQYIKTGIVPNGAKVKVDIKYRFVKVEPETFAFGYWNNDGYGTAIGNSSNSQVRYRVYKTADYYGSVDAALHEVSLNGPEGTFIDGKLVSSELSEVADMGTCEYYVFGRNLVTGKSSSPNLAAVCIYHLAIDLDGKPVRDFVPCRRQSDGELGLYDLVNGDFYDNDGTGEFGAPMSERDIVALPYLESTGNQYIRTGVIPNGRTPLIEATYQYTQFSAQTIGYLFGYWDGSWGTAIGYEQTGGRYRVYNNAVWYGMPDLDWHTVVLNAVGGTTVDGIVAGDDGKLLENVADSGAHEYFVFGRNISGSVDHGASARLRSLKISMNGVLVRDFIPARLQVTDELGLFDKVEGEFYGNNGTGSFKTSDDPRVRLLCYVESTGQQYVDTRIGTGGHTPVVRMRYQMLETLNDTYVFGYWNDAGYGTAVGILSGQIRYRVNDKSGLYGSADTKPHDIVLNAADGTGIDGQLVDTDLGGVSDRAAGMNYVLFGRVRNTGVECTRSRIYSFSMDLDGRTVLDLLPARRLMDGTVGLWDRITGKFYYPRGVPLVAGPEIKKGLMLFVK